MHLIFFAVRRTYEESRICSAVKVIGSNVGHGLMHIDGGGIFSNATGVLCGPQRAIGEARQLQRRVPSVVTAWATVQKKCWEENKCARIR